MSLKQRIRKGDHVVARVGVASRLVGQAAHDLERRGSALLTLILADGVRIAINVNNWDVSVVRENLVPYNEEAE